MSSFLYVIAESDAGPCKVGHAANPRTRLALLQTGNPRRITLEYMAAVGDAETAEQFAHTVLWETRILGEWFDVGVERATAAVRLAVQEVEKVLPPPAVPIVQQPTRNREKPAPVSGDEARVLRLCSVTPLRASEIGSRLTIDAPKARRICQRLVKRKMLTIDRKYLHSTTIDGRRAMILDLALVLDAAAAPSIQRAADSALHKSKGAVFPDATSGPI